MNASANASGRNKKPSVNGWIVFALCILFIAAMLLSSAVIYTHISHEHDHDAHDGSCAACALVAASENLLRFLSAAFAVTTLAAGCIPAFRADGRAIRFRAGLLTPVLLKIRLNN